MYRLNVLASMLKSRPKQKNPLARRNVAKSYSRPVTDSDEYKSLTDTMR